MQRVHFATHTSALGDTLLHVPCPDPPAGLTSLHLSSWHGKQLPASIGQLASLRSLKITGSSIVTLPDSISGLTALTELRMEHCDVRSLPGSLGQLLQLKMLYIDHCEDLLELPASLGALTGGWGELGCMPTVFAGALSLVRARSTCMI